MLEESQKKAEFIHRMTVAHIKAEKLEKWLAVEQADRAQDEQLIRSLHVELKEGLSWRNCEQNRTS